MKSEQNQPAAPDPADVAPQNQSGDAKKGRKKRERIRAAWISFVSRILAQFIGAAASVVLGLLVVQHYVARVDQPATSTGTVVGADTARSAARTGASRTPGTMTLAVLPLQDFSDSEPSRTFADSLTEMLIADLAKIHGLRVISRTSSMQYKAPGKALPQIADELGADLVVEGSIVRADGHVRVTAQLIDARTDEHLWAQSYDRPLRDLLALQAGLAGAIARDVGAALPATSSLAADPRPVADLELK